MRRPQPQQVIRVDQFLIDGVQVTRSIWDRRYEFGEYSDAQFSVVLAGSQPWEKPINRSEFLEGPEGAGEDEA